MRTARLTLAIALSLTAMLFASQQAHAVARSKATPVIMVHGYAGGTCPGLVVMHNVWGGQAQMLTWGGWTGPLLPVSFYACDTDGVDITGYGPDTVAATPEITASHPRAGYTDDTPIDQIAHDLAWFIYDTYTKNGQPVDLIGGSMGGLIVRSAILRVQQQDPTFPPTLLVTDAVTISTPHKGVTPAIASYACGMTPSCQSMITGSSYLASLGTAVPQASGGTDWTLIGSSNCDFVPPSTSLGLWPTHLVQYTNPCYTHTGYLWDYAQTADAAAYYLNPGGTVSYTSTGQHSLMFVRSALLTNAW